MQRRTQGSKGIRLKWPKRRVLLVALAGLGVGLILSWNLITTSDILKSEQSFQKLEAVVSHLAAPQFESTSDPPKMVSVVRLDNTYREKEATKSIPNVETLFRGDIPQQRLELPSVGFPDQNMIGTNGHQIMGEEGGANIEMLLLPRPLKIPYKLVHIDLKGAPPKISYLKSFFKTIRAAGANGILLEYEDMFPFTQGLTGVSHRFHYSKKELQDLISSALEENLEVIPLVQTYGHLEFVLKLEGFRNLREVDSFPQEICPSNEKAWKMVTNMIDQVLSLKYSNNRGQGEGDGGFAPPGNKHRPTYIHIGCDEVFHIGECNKCKDKAPKDLFLNHVRRVGRYVRDTYGVTPIIWDDMLRRYNVEELLKADIGSHVELMMWDYTEDVDRLLNPYLWPMYTQVFPNIWVASAFKGAFGETLHKVDIQRHALNQISWLRVLSRESSKIRNLRGVALTGWSRYDHFSVLCELLPVSIPSLILSLQIWILQDYEKATQSLFKFLKCDERSLARLNRCHWDGVDLAVSLSTLDFYQMQTKSLIDSQRNEKGWLNLYNLAHNYSSPWRLSEAITQSSQYLSSLRSYEKSIRYTLSKYFDDHVVEEWIEQKIQIIRNSLQELLKDAQSLELRRIWERRPVLSVTTNKTHNASAII